MADMELVAQVVVMAAQEGASGRLVVTRAVLMHVPLHSTAAEVVRLKQVQKRVGEYLAEADILLLAARQFSI